LKRQACRRHELQELHEWFLIRFADLFGSQAWCGSRQKGAGNQADEISPACGKSASRGDSQVLQIIVLFFYQN
jgi:hypothetical protein